MCYISITNLILLYFQRVFLKMKDQISNTFFNPIYSKYCHFNIITIKKIIEKLFILFFIPSLQNPVCI